MTRPLLLAVVLVGPLLTLCPGYAQENTALIGRGGAGVAATNEDATGITNPAALAFLEPRYGDNYVPDDNWFVHAGYTSDTEGIDNNWTAQAAVRRMGENWGVAVGQSAYSGFDKPRYGSFGMTIGKPCADGTGSSWGVTITRDKPKRQESKLIYDVGLLHRGKANLFGYPVIWSLGAVGVDLSDEYGRYVNVGLGLDFGRLRLAVDAIDVADDTEEGTTWNVGGEYAVCRYFKVRAGSLDGDLTWGASLQHDRIAVDYAEVDQDDADDTYGMWSVRYVYSF